MYSGEKYSTQGRIRSASQLVVILSALIFSSACTTSIGQGSDRSLNGFLADISTSLADGGDGGSDTDDGGDTDGGTTGPVDPPEVNWTAESISIQVTEGNDGDTQTITLTASLSELPTVQTAVQLTGGGTANNADFTCFSQFLVFGGGDQEPAVQEASLICDIKGDDDFEGDEEIVVVMDSAANATIGSASVATITITNDDDAPPVPMVRWSAASQTIEEGAAGETSTITLTAEINVAPSELVSVPISIAEESTASSESGGTEETADYSCDLSDIVFDVGGPLQVERTCTINGDDEIEPDETIQVLMASPTNADLGSQSVHTVTIENDDEEVIPTTVSWSLQTISQDIEEGDEGSEAEFFLTVQLNQEADEHIQVYLDIEVPQPGSGALPATIGLDLSCNHNPDDPIRIEKGETTASIDCKVIGDNEVEGNEEIYFVLVPPSNATIEGGPAVITITDDDVLELPTISFTSESTTEAIEGKDSQVKVIATLSQAYDDGETIVTATMVLSGSASSPEDYNCGGESPRIVIMPGETTGEKICDLVTEKDDLEGDETIVFTIADAGGKAEISSPSSHTVTIKEKVVNWTVTSQELFETEFGNLQHFTITVARDEEEDFAVSIPIEISGTATPGDDFLCSDINLTIDAGEKEAERNCFIFGDDDYEDGLDETIIFTLMDGGSPSYYQPGADSVQTLTILNDDEEEEDD